MSQTSAENNKRIAKNTLLLYMRSIITMVVALFTSRIILKELGIEDYGIFDAVGGMVAMFSIISGALTNAIQRFITFELGHGDMEKLKRIFTTSVNIQIGLSLIVIVLGETLGLWFLNYYMNIPDGRMEAANWVLHCSLIAFAINLISIPYNAAIVAHERMSAFAYISILEVVLKLAIVYMLALSPIDKLITYSILYVLTSIIIRMVYSIYCNRHFEETKYHWCHDKSLIKEMTIFSGWAFFTNAAALFNTQGINILVNIFFGVTVNAARGITNQVQAALMKLVGDFTTAFNPQITKFYASGELELVHKLVNRGAKFSFFLSLLICLPVMVETDYILHLWLTTVPEHTTNFIRLSIIGTLIDRLGNTGYVACMATGNIRRYCIWITTVGCLAFPITYVAFKLGAPVEACYVVYALVYVGVTSVRLWIMKGLIQFPVMSFIKGVIYPMIVVTVVSCILPYIVVRCIDPGFIRLVVSVIVCLLSVSAVTFGLGLTNSERSTILRVATNKINYIRTRK